MSDGSRNGPDSRQSAALATAGTSALTRCLVVCLQLSLLALLYGQTLAFGFVFFDDSEYVTENAAVLAGLTMDSMRWAFTSFYMSNWHPLTWLSHMLDISLFGPDPGWAHLHNVALHGVNSVLVYALLLQLSGSWWKACVLSLIFLVHPLHVESVAWIAERKDLLSALFFLLGLLLYDAYRSKASGVRYIGVLICFVLALLAKPMAITFPVVLLIFDFFVYRNCFQPGADTPSAGQFDYFRAIVEKLPFLALSAVSSVVTVLAQYTGDAVASVATLSFTARCVTAVIAYVTYLQQSLLPVNLAAFYPINLSVSLKDGLIPMGVLLGLVTLAAVFARKRPLLAAGLCWYWVTLLPVIGLMQVGSQAHADRYMYLPSVGLLIACIYLLPSRDKKYFQLANVLAILFITYLSVLCFWQINYWSNRHILWSRVMDIVGPNYLAHIHLAHDYLQRGMLDEARQHSQAALDFRPDVASPYLTLGDIALADRDYATAERFYRTTLTKNYPPEMDQIIINIGIAMAEQGDIAAGIRAMEDALKVNPASKEAQINLRHYRKKKAQVPTP